MSQEKNISKLGLKALKFQFDVVIEKVHLGITFPCQLSVIWKRGKNKIESKNKPALNTETSEAIYKEKLSMISALYLDEKNSAFHEKKSSFTIVIITSKGNKVAGMANLDLSAAVNQKLLEKNERLRLEKCPDKNAYIEIKAKYTFISEIQDSGDVASSSAGNTTSEIEGISGDDGSDVPHREEKEKRSTLRTNAISFRKKESVFEEEIKVLSESSAIKKAEQVDLFSKIQEKNEEIKGYIKQIQDLKLENSNMHEEISGRQQKEKIMIRKQEELISELNEKQSKVNMLQQEKKQILIEHQAELSRMMNQSSFEIRTKEQELFELQERTKYMLKEYEDVRTKLLNENSELSSELIATRGNFDTLINDLQARSQNEINKLQHHYEDVLSRKETELEELKSALEGALAIRDQLGISQTEVYSLFQEESFIKKLKTEALKGKLGVLEVENGSVKSLNQDLINRINLIEREKEGLVKSQAETEELLEERTKALDRLLENQSSDSNMQKGRIEVLEVEIASLNREKTAIQNESKKKEEALEQLEKLVVASLRLELNDLQTQFQGSNERNIELEEKLEKSMGEILKLELLAKNYEETIHSLKEENENLIEEGRQAGEKFMNDKNENIENLMYLLETLRMENEQIKGELNALKEKEETDGEYMESHYLELIKELEHNKDSIIRSITIEHEENKQTLTDTIKELQELKELYSREQMGRASLELEYQSKVISKKEKIKMERSEKAKMSSSLDIERANYNQALESLQIEKDTQLREKNEEIEVKNQEILSINLQVENLQIELNSMKNALVSKEEQVAQLFGFEKEKDELNAENNNLLLKIDALQNELFWYANTHERNLNEINERNSFLSKKVEEYEDKLNLLETERLEFELKLNNALSLSEQVQEDNKALMKTLDDIKNNSTSSQAELFEEINQLKKEKVNTENHYQKILDEVSKESQKLSEQSLAEREELIKKIDESEKEKNNLNQEHDIEKEELRLEIKQLKDNLQNIEQQSALALSNLEQEYIVNLKSVSEEKLIKFEEERQLYEENLRSERKNIEKLESEIRSLKGELEFFKEESLAERSEYETNLKALFTEKSTEIELLRAEYEEKVLSYQLKLVDLEKRLSDSEQNISDGNQKLSDDSQKIAELTERLNDSERMVKEKALFLAEKEEYINVLFSEHTELKKTTGETIALLEYEKGVLSSQIDGLNVTIKEKIFENQELEFTVEEKEKKIEELIILQENQKELEKKLKETSQSSNNAEREIDALRDMIKQSENEKKALELELNRSDTQLQALSNKYEEEEERLQEATSNLNTLLEENSCLKKEKEHIMLKMNELTGAKEDLEQALDQKSARCLSLENEVKELIIQKEFLENLISDEKAKNEGCHKQISTITIEKEEMIRKIASLEENIICMGAEVNEKAQYSNAQIENMGLNLRHSEEEKNALKKEIANLKENLEQTRLQLEERDSEINELSNASAEIQMKLKAKITEQSNTIDLGLEVQEELNLKIKILEENFDKEMRLNTEQINNIRDESSRIQMELESKIRILENSLNNNKEIQEELNSRIEIMEQSVETEKKQGLLKIEVINTENLKIREQLESKLKLQEDSQILSNQIQEDLNLKIAVLEQNLEKEMRLRTENEQISRVEANEKGELEARIINLKNQIEDIEEQKNKIEMELKNKIANLESSTDELLKKIEQSAKEKSSMTERINELTGSISLIHIEKTNLEKEVATLKTQLENRIQTSVSHDLLQQIEEKNKMLQQELESKTAEINESMFERNTLEEELENMKSELEEKGEEFEEALAKQKQEATSLRKQIQEIENEYVLKLGELFQEKLKREGELQDYKTEATAREKALEEERENLVKIHNIELSQLKSELQNINEAMENQAGRFHKEKIQLLEEKRGKDSELFELKGKNELLESQTQSDKTAIEMYIRKMAHLEEDLESKEKQRKNLESEIEKIGAGNSETADYYKKRELELNGQCELLLKENRGLKDKIFDMESQVKSLQDDSEKTSELLSDEKKSNSDLIEKHKREKSDLIRDKAKLEEEIESLKEEKLTLQKINQKHIETLAMEKHDVEENNSMLTLNLKQQKEIFEKEIKDQERQMEEMTKVIKIKEDDLLKLQAELKHKDEEINNKDEEIFDLKLKFNGDEEDEDDITSSTRAKPKENQYTDLLRENDELKKALEVYTKEFEDGFNINEIKAEKKKASDDFMQMKMKFDDISLKYIDQTNEIRELRLNIRKLEEHVKEVEARKEDKNVKSLKDKIKDLETKNSQLDKDLKNAAKKGANPLLEQRIKNLENEKIEMEQRFVKLNQNIGNAINVSFEIGGQEFCDKISQVLIKI